MALPVDEVVLTLAGDRIRIVENYEVRSSVLTQPAGFSLRLGHGGIAAELIARYPAQTPFQLHVNDRLVQTGWTDGLRTTGAGGTEVTYDGRDVLGRLVSAYAPADRSFSNLTFLDLNQRVLELSGYRDFTILSDDAANRKAISGTIITDLSAAEVEITRRQGAPVGEVTGGTDGTKKTTFRSATLKVGKRWFEFLRTQNDRAGLFLWADGAGDFLLSVPTAAQTPAYRITRIRRGERGIGTVIDHSFQTSTVDRFTKLIVHGRGGGRVLGRNKIQAELVDPEMSAIFGGDDKKILPIHDNDVTSQAQALHLARRRMAELNRDGWRLSYRLSGHSTEGAGGGRALWTPNTVVSVDDREIGIAGDFWVEEVVLRSTPEKTAEVRLMRPQDLFFATELAT